MSTTTEIFYSQVNRSLQDELNARGLAGFSRSTTDLNYMLTKIANIQVTAYRDQEYKTKMYTLGGNEVAKGAYVAGGDTGFLRKKTWSITDNILNTTSPAKQENSYRIPPFITSAEIQLNDHSFGLLNSATILINIPNPDRDLTFMESVFARPGRAIEMKIAHPSTALAAGFEYLQPDTYKIKRQAAFEANDEQLKNRAIDTSLSKLNETVFRGLLISFDYIYQRDGTVSLTLYLRGRADVYTDVSMYVVKKSDDNTAPDKVISYYESIYNEIDTLKNNFVPDQLLKKDIAYVGKGKPVVPTFDRKDFNWACLLNWNNQQQRYISLGYLVESINNDLVAKLNSTAPLAYVECNDLTCFSSHFEDLVSSNPDNIWLPSNNQTKTDAYGTVDNKPRKWYKSIMIKKDSNGNDETALGSFYDKHPDSAENKTVGFPSRIMINLNVIKTIYDKIKTDKNTFNVSTFYSELSTIIFNATGGVINMKLITLSKQENDEIMLYYDANYLGDIYKVTPYSVPMFANHDYGTAVRDVKIQSKLPQNVQSLMYTINQSENISEEMIAPFMSFMYNNVNIQRTVSGNNTQDVIESVVPPDKVKDFKKQYEEFHKKYKEELAKAKNNFSLTNMESRIALETALRKYVQYPTSDIKNSANMISPVYPVHVEFTVDGINGFKYGDALQFDALPSRYKTNTTFSVISIIHSINDTGDWTTKITCVMRPKFN